MTNVDGSISGSYAQQNATTYRDQLLCVQNSLALAELELKGWKQTLAAVLLAIGKPVFVRQHVIDNLLDVTLHKMPAIDGLVYSATLVTAKENTYDKRA